MPNRMPAFSLHSACRMWFVVLLSLSVLSPALLDITTVEAKPVPGDGELPPPSLYFEETGHVLTGQFLDYWRTNGGFMEFGPPVTDQYVDQERGLTVQYFTKARFELRPLPWERGWRVDLGVINREILNGRLPVNEEQVQALKPLTKAPNTNGTRFFQETGHTLSGPFLDRWLEANGTGNHREVTQDEETYYPIMRYGLPLSEPYLMVKDKVQYKAQDFERIRMLLASPSPNALDTSVILDEIGAQTPGIDPATLERQPNNLHMQVYNRTTMPRWVDVNLTLQTAYFMEGGIQVRRSLITSGEWKHSTPVGTFLIWQRVYNERMKNGKPGDPDYYDLKNVLYTQYFTYEGHALHFAWWRDTFGYRDSHGCVNQDINTSRFAWDFLKVGDKVVIHN